jgi:MFS superfamily sulfate permease-like transporter
MTYQARWIPKDLVAGLILTTLLVPQGMAYAALAGLPPITGLYTSILCLAAYAGFGPSKILVLGPDSSLGPMIAATILPLVGANGDPGRAVVLASTLALLAGGVTVLAGIGKLGFVADLVSRPTMIGYLNGLALTIMVGQLPTLILLLAPGMFRNLPQPTLAAVVIAASASLADVRGTVRLLHD